MTTTEKPKRKLAKVIFMTIYKATVIIAPIGLLISIASFLSEAKKSKQLVGNLTKIEQSLSTRHIGIFPDYLDNINRLLSETPHSKKDSSEIIIFKDVLFYGAFHNVPAFKEIIHQLVDFANNGKKITIAYYDTQNGRMFRETVQESWIRQQDLRKMNEKRRELRRSLQQESVDRRGVFSMADSIASEIFFDYYRSNEQREFSRRIAQMLTPFYDATQNDFRLFYNMDNIIQTHLNKPVNTITFYDIFRVYYEITEELKTFFEEHNIRLISLNNYLTMSCWSNGEKVLFAFPGRFAANEIGFISSDRAILDYIATMLEGVESGLENEAN